MKELCIIREEQVQILQRFTQEEALHLVSWPWVGRVFHIVNRRVATIGDLKKRLGDGSRLPFSSMKVEPKIPKIEIGVRGL